MGDRTQYRLAIRLPPPDHPVRTPRPFCAFLTLTAVLTCYKKLPRPNETRSKLNALGLKVLAITVFAQDSHRKDPMLIKQPAYVFAVVKKHLNPEFLTFF